MARSLRDAVVGGLLMCVLVLAIAPSRAYAADRSLRLLDDAALSFAPALVPRAVLERLAVDTAVRFVVRSNLGQAAASGADEPGLGSIVALYAGGGALAILGFAGIATAPGLCSQVCWKVNPPIIGLLVSIVALGAGLVLLVWAGNRQMRRAHDDEAQVSGDRHDEATAKSPQWDCVSRCVNDVVRVQARGQKAEGPLGTCIETEGGTPDRDAKAVVHCCREIQCADAKPAVPPQ